MYIDQKGEIMILDNIKNLKKYENVHPKIKDIRDFLENFDKSDFKPGRIDISEGLFASVQEYNSLPAKEKKFEVHEKYIDLQYIVSASERIDFATKESYGKDYDIDKDGDFFLTNDIEIFSKLSLDTGDFAIFFPGEFHKPGCSLENNIQVHKIVFKIEA